MNNLTIVSVLAVLFCATPSASQTQWAKYAGNPVLDVGPAGSWDASVVAAPRIILVLDTLKMWYTGEMSATNSQVGYAWSVDGGVTWTKYPHNPVLSPAHAWESPFLFLADVAYSNSSYKIWYTTGVGSRHKIGYAVSSDGTLWRRAQNPVLNPGPSPWDAQNVGWPTVLGPDTAGTYRMWYSGHASTLLPQYLGYATATNETTWTKLSQNPVFTLGVSGTWDDGAVEAPEILHDGKTYQMWYSGYRTNLFADSRIGYAISPDGVTWRRGTSNPVLTPSPAGTWDDVSVLGGDIIFDGSIYHMWYTGFDGAKLRVGYAISPKGMSYTVSTKGDSVLVVVRVTNAAGLSFSAEMKSPDGTPVDTLDLFDDGLHGDSLSTDGVFANVWRSSGPNTYIVDLWLKLDTLRFKLNNADTVSILSSVARLGSAIPSQCSLAQNFPNPFNPSTEIQFSLARKSHVTLTVFDLLGREVATLVSEDLPAGSYTTRWDASEIPSGVYLYRLRAGDFVEAKKLVLVR